MKLFIDTALRKSGVVICDDNFHPVESFLIKYKDSFDSLDFSSIVKHKKFIDNVFKSLGQKYQGKKFNLVVLEADVFGNRRGGYRTKEILTTVKLNFAFSIKENLKVKEKNINFITANEWKKYLFGNSSLRKVEYKEKLKDILQDKLSLDVGNIKNQDILDAFGLMAFFYLKR